MPSELPWTALQRLLLPCGAVGSHEPGRPQGAGCVPCSTRHWKQCWKQCPPVEMDGWLACEQTLQVALCRGHIHCQFLESVGCHLRPPASTRGQEWSPVLAPAAIAAASLPVRCSR